MGLKNRSRSLNTNPNQVYRVVVDGANVIMLTAGNLETTTTQSTTTSIDFLGDFFNSANWAAAVANRYGSIRVKGFSVTRTILGLGLAGADQDVPFRPELPFV